MGSGRIVDMVKYSDEFKADAVALVHAGMKRSRFCSAVYARAFALALVLWWFASYSVGVR